MAAVLTGNRTWSGGRDAEGHRTYKLTCRVVCSANDGPSAAMAAPGLPLIGSQWIVGNDIDPWAFCTPEVNITPVMTGEPGSAFDLEYTFSTKPWHRPQGSNVGNPLLEPPKISITFTKTTEEASVDRFNRPIVNSAWERLRGKQIEFDTGMVQVKIEQNLGFLDLATLAACYQTVNSVPLWGMPPRTIKLSEASINEQYYGQRQVYYQRSLQFEVNYKGWGKALLDEGTKVLFGHYISAGTTTTLAPTTTSAGATTTSTSTTTTTTAPTLPSIPDPIMWELYPVDKFGNMPDPNNPSHFVKHQDRYGNVSRVVLNGAGIPAGTVATTGQTYICIYSNTGQPLTNGSYWCPIAAPLVFYGYDSLRDYSRGECVTDPTTGFTYVAVAPRVTVAPSPSDPRNWANIYTATNRGNYNISAVYNVGDYVRDTTPLGAGVIYVEKYNEVDFVFALGIPVNLVPVGQALMTPEWLPSGHQDAPTPPPDSIPPASGQSSSTQQSTGLSWNVLPERGGR